MTYKESYQKCNTLNDLKAEVKKDMMVLAMMGGDEARHKIIEESVNEVLTERGWEWVDVVKECDT